MSTAFDDLGSGASHDDVFKKVDDLRDAHVYLFYGDQGVGKTFTALSTDRTPIFIIDTELRAQTTTTEQYPAKDIRIFEPVDINFDEVDPENPLEDAIDIRATLDNVNNAIVSLVNGYRDGDLEGGTVILDSATDLWDWVMEAGKLRLMEVNGVDEATFRLENQMDWGGIKSKHYKMLTGLRVLSRQYGADVILTAREKEIPEYADSNKSHYIKCENSVPFMCDVNVRFTKEARKGQVRHVAKFDKIGSNNQPAGEMVDPTFEQIREAVEAGEIPEETTQEAKDDEDGSGGF